MSSAFLRPPARRGTHTAPVTTRLPLGVQPPAEGPGVRPWQQVLCGVTPKYSLTPFSDFSIVALWR